MFLIDDFYEKHNFHNPFKGEIQSTIVCNNCKFKSETKQDFLTLSLKIEDETTLESLIEDYEKNIFCFVCIWSCVTILPVVLFFRRK